MNIIESLGKAYHEHIKAGHPNPSAIYLGHKEKLALIDELRKNNIIYFMTEDLSALRWQGLLVYTVEAKSHIAFC